MAHKGRPYKLQFRRDLADVPNNNQAYPECADFSSSCLGGLYGSVLTDQHFLVVNLLTDAQPPMVWVSDDIPIGGVNLHYKVSIADPWRMDTTNVRLEIIRSSDGHVYFAVSGNGMDVGAMPGFWFADAGTIEVTSSEIHGTCGPQRFLWVNAPYQVYNP